MVGKATPGLSWIEGGRGVPSEDDPELRAEIEYERAREEKFGPTVDSDLNRVPPEEVAKATLRKRRATMSAAEVASVRDRINAKLREGVELAAAAAAGRREHIDSTRRAPPRKRLRAAAPLPRREGSDAGEEEDGEEGPEGSAAVGDEDEPADGVAKEVHLGTLTAGEGHERDEWRRWGKENRCRVTTITGPKAAANGGVVFYGCCGQCDESQKKCPVRYKLAGSGDGAFQVFSNAAAHAGGLRPARRRKVERPGVPGITREQLDEVGEVIDRLGSRATPQQVHDELPGPVPGSPVQRAVHRRRAEDRKGQQTNRLHGLQEWCNERLFDVRAAEGAPADKERFVVFQDEELPVTSKGSVKIAFTLWPFIEFAAREIDSVNGFCAMSDFASKIVWQGYGAVLVEAVTLFQSAHWCWRCRWR